MGDSPKQTNPTAAPQPVNNGATSPNGGLVFNSSEIGTKTAQKQDVFAEHKRKAAEQKAKNKLTRRRVLIFGGIGVALIVVLIAYLVQQSKLIPVSDLPPEEQIKNVEANSELSMTVYQKAQETADNGGSAEEAFNEAINNARNTAEANVIRVAQMKYTNATNSDNTNGIITIGEATATGDVGPCEDPTMDVRSRAVCHNLLAIAYYEEMKHEKSEYHEQRAEELIGEYMKLRGEGDL